MPWPKCSKNNRALCKPQWEAFLVDPALQRLPLYGNPRRRDNPGKDQHVHIAGAGAQQDARTRVDGSAGCQHVVDKDKPLTVNRGLAERCYGECALDVHGSRAARQTDLLGGGARASEGGGEKRDCGVCGHHPCEGRGLIEPPPPQPSPMQRDRDYRIRVLKQRPASTRHPLAHRSGEVEPGAILESMDKIASDVIVADGGGAPSIGGGGCLCP